MARTVDEDLRSRLLDAIAADLVANGLVGASLERLATAAGTSARMLVHHFGGRDDVLDLSLDRARRRQMTEARAALPASADFRSHLDDAWSWFVRPRTRKYFKLFSQVASMELDRGGALVRGQMASEWLDLLGDGFQATGHEPADAKVLATIVSAQLRGLFLDLDATGDTERVGAAYRKFVDLLPAEPEVSRPDRT